MGADLVDRAFEIRGDERAIGAHLGAPALVGAVQHGARLQQAVLDEPAERNARLAALGRRVDQLQVGDRLHLGDALLGDGDVVGIALQAAVVAAELPGDGAGGEIRSASCRESVVQALSDWVVAGFLNKKNYQNMKIYK